MSTQTTTQAPPVWQFSGYTLVPADGQYRRLAGDWTKADEFHRETTTGDFWVNTKENYSRAVERYVLLDAEGEPVFFFRLTRAARIDIQFAPTKSPRRQLIRNRNALMCGFSWLKWIADKSGIAQLIFQTSNAPLAAFAAAKLGFKRTEGEHVFGVEMPTDDPTQ